MKSVCGLDVHKDSVYLCILSEFGELIEKVFGVLTYQLEEMRDLMLHYHVVEVSMESTSVYWIPIWRVLSPHFKLNLANPYFIKQLPGRKSDVKDAQWIAECTMKELIRGSFVPPETIQQLRQYDRRIFDLNEEIVRKLSKLDAVLQRCNIRLSNYVSNVDSKSYKAVVRAISQGITDPEELVKLIHGRIIKHHGMDVITASLKGVVSLAEIDMISQLRDELDMAEAHKEKCQARMLEDTIKSVIRPIPRHANAHYCMHVDQKRKKELLPLHCHDERGGACRQRCGVHGVFGRKKPCPCACCTMSAYVPCCVYKHAALCENAFNTASQRLKSVNK